MLRLQSILAESYLACLTTLVIGVLSPFLSCYALDLEIVPTTKRVFLSTTVRSSKADLKVELWSARNEYESVQVAMRSDSTITIDSIDCTELKNAKTGEKIAKKHFKVRLAEFVYVIKNTNRTPTSELDGIAPGWFPDPLEDVRTFKFSGTRSFLATWYVPPDTAPGDYSGTLTIKTLAEVHRIPVVLHVWNFTLPTSPSLFVTNWLHISQIESQYKVKRGSPQFWAIIDKVATDMIDHRQNVIFTPLSLIRSTILPNGSYAFDFKDYEKWVQIFMKKGFAAIEGSHLFHPTSSYDLYQYVGGSPVGVRFDRRQLETSDGKKYVAALLTALHRENIKLGIQDKYLQHVGDEPKPEQSVLYKDVAAIVHRTMPGTPIIDAIDHPSDAMDELTDIQVSQIGLPIRAAYSATGARWGKWWYTSVLPRGKYPNRFIDYPLVKMRVIPWLSWCNGMNGYLHYGYNWWMSPSGKPPQEDVEQSGKYPPGDGFIVYPPLTGKGISPVSSLRWEVFRDGLEDYEYLRLLKKWKDACDGKRKAPLPKRDSLNTAQLEEAKRLFGEICGMATGLETYPRDPAFFLSMRHRIGGFLSKVSK